MPAACFFARGLPPPPSIPWLSSSGPGCPLLLSFHYYSAPSLSRVWGGGWAGSASLPLHSRHSTEAAPEPASLQVVAVLSGPETAPCQWQWMPAPGPSRPAGPQQTSPLSSGPPQRPAWPVPSALPRLGTSGPSAPARRPTALLPRQPCEPCGQESLWLLWGCPRGDGRGAAGRGLLDPTCGL